MAVKPKSPERAILLLTVTMLGLTLFSKFLRNQCHVSEAPIALLLGTAFGPEGLGLLTPNFCGSQGCGWQESWGWGDREIQNLTRLVAGIQVFAVGISLPKPCANHWKSVFMLLVPVMSWGWLVCCLACNYVFSGEFDLPTSLIISACLTATDPVLASSILDRTPLSTSVPKRLRDLLKTESGSNDGMAYPFLFIGLQLARFPPRTAVVTWVMHDIVYKCFVGLLGGFLLGLLFNRILRFCHRRDYMSGHDLLLVYLFAAVVSIALGSVTGMDEFLVAFGAGYGFAHDGWFSEMTKESNFLHVIDDLLTGPMFMYMGTIMPWQSFLGKDPVTPWIALGSLTMFAILVLLFRRLPIMYAVYQWIPAIETPSEALFCGHFGPIGPGALFLAIEAKAILETGTSEPLPFPPTFEKPYSPREKAILSIWPIVAFTVFASTLVHGFSVAVMMLIHRSRKQRGHERSTSRSSCLRANGELPSRETESIL